MKTRILSSVLFLLVTGTAVAADAANDADPRRIEAARPAAVDGRADAKAIKALGQWMKAYRTGSLDLRKLKKLNTSAIGVKAGVLEKGEARGMNHKQELERICELVAQADSAKAAKALLDVAATGLVENKKLDDSMQPVFVRETGEQYLARITNTEALDWLSVTAGTASKGSKMALQAAALRDVGNRKDERFVSAMEGALDHDHRTIRLAAVDALYRSKIVSTLPAVTARADKETDEVVLARLLDTMLLFVKADAEGIDDKALREATTTAVQCVGRSTWRVDVAAVDFLEKVRNADAVPALIEVLSRFEAQAVAESLKARAKGKGKVDDGISGLLQFRAHEVLVSLTGAVFPAENPKKWQDWWTGAKDTFKVAEKPKRAKAKTDAGEFFGIPVRGSRILFVVDVSGSMNFPLEGKPGERGSLTDKELKIDVAKRELLKAVDHLTPDDVFNLVSFSVDASPWKKDLVPATEKTKGEFGKFVQKKLKANGGTNIWAGLSTGLKIKSLVRGDRYQTTVDEVFILSDGLPSPTIGDVYDPKEIIRLVRETNSYSRVRINTIYISGDPATEKRHADEAGMTGSDLMKKLAELSGGKFVEF